MRALTLQPSTRWSLFIFCLAFSAFYLFLSFCNRLQADDFVYAASLRDRGAWGTLQFMLQNWTARPASLLWMSVLIGWFGRYAACAASLLNFLLALLVFTRLTRELAARQRITVSRSDEMLFSAGLTSAFFFASVSIPETWFWLCASTAYITGTLVLLLGFILVFSAKGSWSSILLMGFCFLFAAGACEGYTPMVITGLMLLIYKRTRQKGMRGIHRDPVFRNAFSGLIIFTVVTVWLGLSAGFAHRAHLLQHAGTGTGLYIAVKGCVRLLGFTLLKQYAFLLLLVPPFYFAGRALRGETDRVIPAATFLKHFLLALLLIAAAALITALPPAFMMSEMPPPRALAHLSLLLALIFAGFAAYAGFCFTSLPRLLLALPAVLVIIMCWFYMPAALHYAKRYDERERLLLETGSSGYRGIYSIAPLPPPGLLDDTRLSPDPAFYRNRQLMHYLDLPYELSVNNP
jgi:hypothetical protein